MVEPQEHHQRVGRLAQLMRGEGLSGAIFTAESNIAYFSGFRSHAPWMTFSRPNFLVVSADGRCALLGSGFVEPEMRRMSFVTDVRVYGQAAGIPVGQLSEIIAEFGMRQDRIGMELGYEQRLDLSHLDFLKLEAALHPTTLCDVSTLVWKLRMVKSPAEVALLRTSCDITGEALRRCFEAARPGVTEKQLGQIAADTMVSLGAERPGFVLVTSGAGNYHVMSGKPTDRALQRGDVLWMDMGAVYGGYWSDFCRTAFLGPPNATLNSDQDLIIDVNAAAIDTARVGRTMSEVADAAVKAFKRHDMVVTLGQGRIGHGIGLMSTEPPHLALFDETVCEEGLVFTVEPRFVREHGLFNCEEIIVVTKSGAELLTSAPRHVTYIQ